MSLNLSLTGGLMSKLAHFHPIEYPDPEWGLKQHPQVQQKIEYHTPPPLIEHLNLRLS